MSCRSICSAAESASPMRAGDGAAQHRGTLIDFRQNVRVNTALWEAAAALAA